MLIKTISQCYFYSQILSNLKVNYSDIQSSICNSNVNYPKTSYGSLLVIRL